MKPTGPPAVGPPKQFVRGRGVPAAYVRPAYYPAQSSDDAVQTVTTGAVTLTAAQVNNLSLASGDKEWAGFRFPAYLPPHAHVLSANLELAFPTSKADDVNARLWTEAADDPAPFTTATSDISSRSRSVASVDWVAANQSGGALYVPSPDLRTIVQEWADRPGRGPTSHLVLLVQALSSVDSANLGNSFDAGANVWRLAVEFYTPESIGPAAIAGGEAVGTASVGQQVRPPGVASAEAFGGAAVGQQVRPSGVAGAEALGAPRVSQQVRPAGVTSAEAFGTARVNQQVRPTGVASAEVFGTAVVTTPTPQTVSPSSVASAEALGTARVGQQVRPVGVAGAAAAGVPRVNQQLRPSGVSSAEIFGTTTVATTAGGPVLADEVELGRVRTPFEAEDPLDEAWRAARAREPWSADRAENAWHTGTTMARQHRLSLEYVKVPVRATNAGAPVNPTSATVEMAFTAVDSAPVGGDWKAATWETDAVAEPDAYLARCLVGPGGTVSLAAGTYAVWVRITGLTPQLPVLRGADSKLEVY